MTFVPRMRGFHAPIHVRNEVAAATLRISLSDAQASVAVNGVALSAGQVKLPVALASGMNTFQGRITSADGAVTRDFNVRVVRDLPQPRWERLLAQAPFPPRDSAGELVFNDRMWLLGGYTPRLAGDVWSSDDGIHWSHDADLPSESGIDIPMAFVLNDRMFVADYGCTLFSSTDGKSWARVSDDLPWGLRYSAGCTVFNGKAWIFGGRRESGELLNDVWSSSDGVNWTLELAHAPWCGRMIHHTPVVLNGRMWLLGGGAMGADYHPFVAWNDVWSTTDGKNWERTVDRAPWPARIWGSSAVYRDRMWVIGGFRAEPVWENLGDVWYSADGAQWHRLDIDPIIRHSGSRNMHFEEGPAIWYRRHEQSVYTHKDSLWLVAGMIWPLLSDVWRLHLPGLSFLTQPPLQTYVGCLYEYAARADFNHNCSTVKYRVTQGPDWLQVDANTGRLHGTPRQAGEWPVVLEAFDNARETASQTFTLQVLECR